MVFGRSQPSGMHHMYGPHGFLPIYVHDQMKVAVMEPYGTYCTQYGVFNDRSDQHTPICSC